VKPGEQPAPLTPTTVDGAPDVGERVNEVIAAPAEPAAAHPAAMTIAARAGTRRERRSRIASSIGTSVVTY
jgi:hypothetical protein